MFHNELMYCTMKQWFRKFQTTINFQQIITLDAKTEVYFRSPVIFSAGVNINSFCYTALHLVVLLVQCHCLPFLNCQSQINDTVNKATYCFLHRYAHFIYSDSLVSKTTIELSTSYLINISDSFNINCGHIHISFALRNAL